MLLNNKDKPAGLAILIAKRMKDKPEKLEEKEVSEDGAEMDREPGYEHAVEKMMMASKQDDKNSFKHALKDFISLCFDELEARPENEEVEEAEKEG